MSRRYNIRWAEADDAELKRVVKNYNAKISRLEKKDPKNKSALPERVTVKQMRELISTRQDLNREINALSRFTQRGAEELVTAPDNKYNLKMTKWQRAEMNRRVGVINRRRKDRLKKVADVELKSRGKNVGYKRGYVGSNRVEELELSPIRAFTPSMTRRDLSEKFRTIQNESQDAYWDKRDLQLKDNYIKSLEENFSAKDIQEVINTIDDMSIEEFRKIFDAEEAIFEHSYPPDGEQYKKEVNAIKSIWTPSAATQKPRRSRKKNK